GAAGAPVAPAEGVAGAGAEAASGFVSPDIVPAASRAGASAAAGLAACAWTGGEDACVESVDLPNANQPSAPITTTLSAAMSSGRTGEAIASAWG
ncbi:MAG TPA: hypothetical protein PKC15_15785, partial [Rhodocyclaceae bacterium]|nr:hypothetical protein [Rhodocyclaceae bacterium]